jgi:VWFA-related protein
VSLVVSPITKFVSALLVAASAAPVAAQGLDAQQPVQVFRASADVVTIQASVKDRRGRVVRGLTPADFEIRDNGEIRQIVSLRADRDSPLSLAVLVDMSGSMRSDAKIALARQAYDAILTQLRQGQDEAAVFIFDSELHQRQRFTSDLGVLKSALNEFDAFGTTSLYDATAAAARQLSQQTGTHKAILLLTDGLDTSSAMTASEVSAIASSIDVPVFVVATVPSVDERLMLETSERPSAEAADLRDLSDWTGGKFVFASTVVETVATASKLVEELRQQYVLAIEAAPSSEWRRLDVRVKRPSAKVKARSGYFGG